MKKQVLYLTRGAMIAALYVVLTWLTNLFGLASGVIQFRLSEILTILPVFFPEAIPGLTIGCLLANLLTGCAPWDVVFGSFATFLGALGTFLLAKSAKSWVKWIYPLPTILANMIIVPPILVLVYEAGTFASLPYFALTVGVGELVCAGVLGLVFYHILAKYYKGRKV